MSLKEICKKNILSQILNLPPILKEEILNESIVEIKKQIKKDLIKEIVSECEFIIDDITNNIIINNNNLYWTRSNHTSHIDNDLYQIFVVAAQNFIQNQNNIMIDNF